MNNKKYAYMFTSLAVLTILATAVPALADATASTTIQLKGNAWGANLDKGMDRGNKANMKPAVFGTVSAVNGNTITVTGKQGFGANAVATTFTIDATSAKIMKNNVAGTISSILVGDTVIAQGTLTGTNLVATMIRDGQMGKGMRGGPNDNQPGKTPTTSPITGNGQPIVAGTVSSINGSTLTITNKSNVSYTVDTTNAKIVQGQNNISISNIAVGNMIVVQGTVNGNSVIATSVIDQAKTANTTANTSEQPHQGFFAGIGSFFAHIFGF